MQGAFTQHYRADAVRQFHSLKALAEGALAQLDDQDLFITLDEEANSIAVLLKHMAGSMHTRWAGFPATAEDTQGRDRDSEFTADDGDTKEVLIERWEAGWRCLFAALERLTPDCRDSGQASLGDRGDQSPAHPLRLPRRPDRLPGEAFPVRRMAVAQYPAGEVRRVYHGSAPQA